MSKIHLYAYHFFRGSRLFFILSPKRGIEERGVRIVLIRYPVTICAYLHGILGGVYMIPVRLSFWYEFTPVPSCGSLFVYMIPAQNLTLERVIPVRVHPGNCTGARFSFLYENSFRCHVNAVQLFAPAWHHSPGSLERAAQAQSSTSNPIWRHNHFGWHEVSINVNTAWNHSVILVSNSHRCEFPHVNTPLYT